MVDVDSIIATVQQKSGLSEDKVQQTVGAILSYAKQHGIPVPEQAQKYVDTVESQNQSNKDSGEHSSLVDNAIGFLSSVNLNDDTTTSRASDTNDTATKNGGEVDTVPELLGVLKKFGITPQQAMSALPMILKLLKDNNIDISPIVSKIPGAQEYIDQVGKTPTTTTTASTPAPAADAPAPAAATEESAAPESADITTQATDAVEQAAKELGGSLMGQAKGFLGGWGK